jgi:ATP-dependent Clp protease adapter protein ClpS
MLAADRGTLGPSLLDTGCLFYSEAVNGFLLCGIFLAKMGIHRIASSTGQCVGFDFIAVHPRRRATMSSGHRSGRAETVCAARPTSTGVGVTLRAKHAHRLRVAFGFAAIAFGSSAAMLGLIVASFSGAGLGKAVPMAFGLLAGGALLVSIGIKVRGRSTNRYFEPLEGPVGDAPDGEPYVEVVIHNDDTIPFEFVLEALVNVFGMTADVAQTLAREAHMAGQASLGHMSEEAAREALERIRAAAQKHGFPLRIELC